MSAVAFPHFFHISATFSCYTLSHKDGGTASPPENRQQVEQRPERRRDMKRQIIIGAMAVAALAGGAWSAQAEFGPDDGGPALHEGCGERGKMDPERHLARMAKELKLTDAQKEKVQAVFKAEHDKNAPLREKLADNRKQLRQAAEAESFDEAAAKTLAASQANLQAELIVSRLRVQSQIRAILTPEQRELAKKLHPMKGEKGRGRHKGGMRE